MKATSWLIAAKKMTAPVTCAAALIIPVVVWLVSVGDPFKYMHSRVPPGQALYVSSKLCGLLALALFWFQCMTALARFAPILRDFLHLGRVQHALLGAGTFALASAHVFLFVGASSMRTGHSDWAVLIPTFDRGYFAVYVSLGVIAFWLLLAVVIAGVFRRLGNLKWEWVHRSFVIVFALAVLHGIAIGSETRFGPMGYIYAFFGLSLVASVGSWIRLQLAWRAGLDGLTKAASLQFRELSE